MRNLQAITKAQALLDYHCKNCPLKTQLRKSLSERAADQHCLKKCEIGTQLTELGEYLIDKEEEKCRFSQAEILYIENHYTLFPPSHLAKRLRKSHKAVEKKIKMIKFRERLKEVKENA